MDIKVMGHHSVVATLWIRATPERITPKKQAAFSQKRSGSERAGELSSLLTGPVGEPAEAPELRRLKYENKSEKAINTMSCGK
tara:strand:+ start:1325 stop:1573 length:249 start_codon:yes stop_codon:yes gene_type:complete